jgi:hypothetical protein
MTTLNDMIWNFKQNLGSILEDSIQDLKKQWETEQEIWIRDCYRDKFRDLFPDYSNSGMEEEFTTDQVIDFEQKVEVEYQSFKKESKRSLQFEQESGEISIPSLGTEVVEEVLDKVSKKIEDIVIDRLVEAKS